jgi:hypothetical protein
LTFVEIFWGSKWEEEQQRKARNSAIGRRIRAFEKEERRKSEMKRNKYEKLRNDNH